MFTVAIGVRVGVIPFAEDEEKMSFPNTTKLFKGNLRVTAFLV